MIGMEYNVDDENDYKVILWKFFLYDIIMMILNVLWLSFGMK